MRPHPFCDDIEVSNGATGCKCNAMLLLSMMLLLLTNVAKPAELIKIPVLLWWLHTNVIDVGDYDDDVDADDDDCI